MGLALAACAGSGLTYVSHRQSGTFLAVPGDWTVYEGEDVLRRQSRDVSPELAQRLEQVPWAVGLDAAPDPSLEHVFVFSGIDGDLEHPSGYARVRALTPNERDQFSLAALRNELIPVDRLLGDGGLGQLVEVQDVSGDDGLKGSRIVMELTLDGDESFTYDQTSVVDGATSTVHLLVLGCESECYDRYAAEIERIADSMTIVKEP